MAERNNDTVGPEQTGLSNEEIVEQGSEELSERQEMSLINANISAPADAAVVADVLSDNATAHADEEQDTDIDQSN